MEKTDEPFSIHEIKKCIRKLKIDKNAGPDLISNEVIKRSNIITNN